MPACLEQGMGIRHLWSSDQEHMQQVTIEGLRLTVQHEFRFVMFLYATLVLPTVPLMAQSDSQGAALLLRTQAVSIAQESWPQLADSAKPRAGIKLSIKGGMVQSVVENAFLGYIGQQGVTVYSGDHVGEPYDIIELTILEQAVRYRALPNESFQRDVRTVVEASRTLRANGNKVYAGIYERNSIDTVKTKEDMGIRNLTQNSDVGLFDRIVGPLVLISSAFIVVYLFFTVRN